MNAKYQKRRAARRELKTSILRAKALYLSKLLDWVFLDQEDLSIHVEEDAPVTVLDSLTCTIPAMCPVTGRVVRSGKAIIRYRRLHVRINWTWWLHFRLKHVVGVHVHRNIPVHVVPGDHYRSIMIGWLEEPEQETS